MKVSSKNSKWQRGLFITIALFAILSMVLSACVPSQGLEGGAGGNGNGGNNGNGGDNGNGGGNGNGRGG